MISLKEVTDSSWLLIDIESQQSVGLLSTKPDNSLVLLMGGENAHFETKNDLTEFLGFDLFIQSSIESYDEQRQNYINGFPVEYNEIYPVYNHSSGLPTFSKSATSDTLYCAGYYCLKRKHGWAKSFCSKLDTLSKYDHEGPFKTAVEAKSRLSALSSKRNKK